VTPATLTICRKVVEQEGKKDATEAADKVEAAKEELDEIDLQDNAEYV